MQKPLLLWDFDGVMADSSDFVYQYWRASLAEHGYDFRPEDHEATYTHQHPFEFLTATYPDVAEPVAQDYTAYEAAHYRSEVAPFPNFISHFTNLADRFEHHLISSNQAAVMVPWLQRHQLDQHFTSVLGREIPTYKDAKITQLLQARNIDPANVYFIGDTISDIEHGHRAGVKPIAVTWGIHSREILEPTNPHQLCDTVEELFEFLKN